MSEEQYDDTKEIALKTKVQTEFPEFTDTVDKLGLEDLDKNMLKYAKYREETEAAKKNDKHLNKAKDDIKELNAPYNETLKAIKLKMAYLHLLLEDKKPPTA